MEGKDVGVKCTALSGVPAMTLHKKQTDQYIGILNLDTKDKNLVAFFALLRAGLWEKKVRLEPYGEIDFKYILNLVEEQSVVGLIAAGIEHAVDGRPAKKDVLQLIGRTVQLEQRNQAMNYFIGVLVEKMREAGIYALLVKGQGVAQCYERPLWRACGDIDLFLSDDNYEKAKAFLTPLAASVEEEYVREKHMGMSIDSWVVELHGRLYSGLSSRIEKELDNVYRDSFHQGDVRFWDNNGVQVFQLSVENDAFYVFTHILQHFFKEGVGLRQICDWCRLLWKHRESLNTTKLESRVKRAGLLSEWKAFAAYAVEWLGMPADAMPMYDSSDKWIKKTNNINRFILSVGNMGHNRDMSHFSKYPYLIRKCVSMGRRTSDLINHARIFPLDSLRFFPRIMWNGVKSAVRGEG